MVSDSVHRLLCPPAPDDPHPHRVQRPQADARYVTQGFEDPRAGYVPDGGDRTATRYDEEADGMMAGLDEMEMVVTGAVMGVDVEAAQEQALGTALGVIRGGGVLASSLASSGLVSDFDPSFFVKTHPVSFPHGTGKVPKGMSLETYARILVERSVGRPSDEGGEDVMLILAMFNIIQRHQALSTSRAKIMGRPDDFMKLDAMTDDDLGRLYRACVVGESAPGLGGPCEVDAHLPTLSANQCGLPPLRPLRYARGSVAAGHRRV